MKVLVVDGSAYYWPNEEFGPLTENINDLKDSPGNISLIVFTGGADISPTFYGHKKNSKTWCSDYRDRRDKEVFDLAQKYNIPCVGICRGGQFLTAMAGGFLYQHVNNHGMCHHGITTSEGHKFVVSGDHHQMFGGLPKSGELLAWTTSPRSTIYETGNGEGIPDVEPEVIFYSNINALAVQYHPEWMNKSDEGVIYYKNLLRKFFK